MGYSKITNIAKEIEYMNTNDTQNCDLAHLSEDQLTSLKSFEKEFNEKHKSRIYIMAFDRK